ncbi:MAG TPA: hypothetical protein VKX28_02940 [Xanthobacteraceae bacterium]|nr:hypothetical protein [Xanthobacteraceae bacterium]
MARRLAHIVSRPALVLLLAALAGPGAAQAQEPPKYQVTGFRGALFGMTEAQVRDVAKKAFRVDDGQMTLTTDPATSATKLIVHVHELEPGLGVGRVEYLFGYRQHQLFQVNVVWGLDTNPQLDNSRMLDAAMRLQGYFLGFSWAYGTVQIGIPLDERSVRLFGGADRNNGAVTVAVENVRYGLSGGNVRLVPEVSVPTIVTITYLDQTRAEDMRTISRKEF